MDTKKTTIALNGAVLLLMLGVGLITPILPGKIYSLSHSAVQVGVLAAAFACAYVIIQVPLGIFADRYGYKHFIVIGYILCGIAGIFYIQTVSSPLILFGRIIQGLGEAPLWALAPAILSIINEKTKGKTIGWYNASIHLGLTGGSLIGFVSLQFFTETHIFIVYILFCTISAIWTFLGIPNTRMADPKPELQNREERLGLLKDSGVMAVLLGIFLYGVGYGVFMTSIPNYMSNLVFSNHNLSGLTFIAFYVGITLAQFIGGPIADNRGRLLPMLGGLCLYSICMLLFFHASTFFSLLILFVASFGLGLFLVGSIPFLNDQAGLHSKGFTSGLFYFFWGGGYFLGPIILGYTGKYNYYPIGFSAIGISGIVVTFLIVFTCRRSYSKKN